MLYEIYVRTCTSLVLCSQDAYAHLTRFVKNEASIAALSTCAKGLKPRRETDRQRRNLWQMPRKEWLLRVVHTLSVCVCTCMQEDTRLIKGKKISELNLHFFASAFVHAEWNGAVRKMKTATFTPVYLVHASRHTMRANLRQCNRHSAFPKSLPPATERA